MFFAPAVWLHSNYSIIMPMSVSLELHRQFGAAILVAGGALHSALWSGSTNTLCLVSRVVIACSTSGATLQSILKRAKPVCLAVLALWQERYRLDLPHSSPTVFTHQCSCTSGPMSSWVLNNIGKLLVEHQSFMFHPS